MRPPFHDYADSTHDRQNINGCLSVLSRKIFPAKTSIIILMIADFTAETFACHRCGPYYFTVHQDQELPKTSRSESIEEVAETILNGGIAAIKGIGGIFLVCSATDSDAIARLRIGSGIEKINLLQSCFHPLRKPENIVKLPLKSKIY